MGRRQFAERPPAESPPPAAGPASPPGKTLGRVGPAGSPLWIVPSAVTSEGLLLLSALRESPVVPGPEMVQNWTQQVSPLMWPHQCPVQGDGHCPGPVGHTIGDTDQLSAGVSSSLRVPRWRHGGADVTRGERTLRTGQRLNPARLKALLALTPVITRPEPEFGFIQRWTRHRARHKALRAAANEQDGPPAPQAAADSAALPPPPARPRSPAPPPLPHPRTPGWPGRPGRAARRGAASSSPCSTRRPRPARRCKGTAAPAADAEAGRGGMGRRQFAERPPAESPPPAAGPASPPGKALGRVGPVGSRLWIVPSIVTPEGLLLLSALRARPGPERVTESRNQNGLCSKAPQRSPRSTPTASAGLGPTLACAGVPRTGCSIQGGVSAEQRGRIPSLDLLLLVQPRCGVPARCREPRAQTGHGAGPDCLSVCLSPMSFHPSRQGRHRGREAPGDRGSLIWDREDEPLVLPLVTFLARWDISGEVSCCRLPSRPIPSRSACPKS
ncbi:nascent polypeptide-associated complex subunit alpha, muscle-specific form-like [Parus major]|uniref:nascent polypeptide-associated complex subunit alpha, muscle-specific form-like n=1 Tax=Parus major TaxID=9157 RepID=UPI001443DF18|nr:nascent polypeptide-associated complex subunit alpha, muscle-specific form-like [Parus major]